MAAGTRTIAAKDLGGATAAPLPRRGSQRVAGGKREARSRRTCGTVPTSALAGAAQLELPVPPLPGRTSPGAFDPVAALVPRSPPATLWLPLRGAPEHARFHHSLTVSRAVHACAAPSLSPQAPSP